VEGSKTIYPLEEKLGGESKKKMRMAEMEVVKKEE